MELYCQLSALGSLPEAQPLPVTRAQRETLAAFGADPRMRSFVLELDGKVAATLTLYLLPNLSHGGRPFAMVENVVVDAVYRGQGLGKLLMAHAEELAKRHGCYKVTLTSNNNRADAHRFYESIGYQRSHQGMTKLL